VPSPHLPFYKKNSLIVILFSLKTSEIFLKQILFINIGLITRY